MQGQHTDHEATLLGILSAVGGPVSLTILTDITALQKTTVSSVLHNAEYWGKCTSWTEPGGSQTYFQFKPPSYTINTIRHAPWTRWCPPPELLHPDFVGNLKLTILTQYRT